MSKRRGATVENVQKWISEGHGQGIGRHYRPFFHVRDVASHGRSSMALGLKTDRVHQYLSDLEFSCHLLAEYAPTVTDIREQFALLPWDETQRIAESLGIRHPIYPGTNTPIVMTSDLVLSIEIQKAAVLCVKPYSEIDPANPRAQRTMEKLLIEKTYWDRRGIPWQLVTEREIPAIRVKNLDRLRMGMVAVELDRLNSQMDLFLSTFNSNWGKTSSLLSILDRTAARTNLSREECYALFSRAVWMRLLHVDIDAELIHHDQPLPRFAS